MSEIKIISAPSKTQQYLVIYKPRGMPSAPLKTEDTNNAFFYASQLFPELLNVKGRKEIEHGLIHRLDTVTDGLLIIASTQECYEKLLSLQVENKIKKFYTAECEINNLNSKILGGFPEFEDKNDFQKNNEYVLCSYFRGYGEGNKSVRPVTEKSGKAALNKVGKLKEYTTNVKILEKNDKKVKVECMITNGYRHQVRCHLAWLGLPIINDHLYNSNSVENDENNIKFTASKIDICGKIWYI